LEREGGSKGRDDGDGRRERVLARSVRRRGERTWLEREGKGKRWGGEGKTNL